jgi:sulfur-oxidizing protein SoxY
MGPVRHSIMAAAALAAAAASPHAAAAAAADEGNWPSIRDALFAGRELRDGASVIALEAPARASDAAVVPVSVKALIPQTPERYIKAVHLIIDQNPAPVAGVFRLFPETGDATLSTRVRVNEYTNVRAVAETSDGQLHMVERFVKAAGGCSAPAQKDKEAAMARLGQMRLKPLEPFAPGEPNQVQLLVSHPQYSGLQIDQVSRNWIPPDYVRSLKVSYAGRPVLEVEGDISLSEDPSITFNFVPREPGALEVVVDDSSQRRFEKRFEVGGAGS